MTANIYYYEGSPIAAPLTIESNQPSFSSDSVSLVHERVNQGAQRWELSFRVIDAGDIVELFLGSATQFNQAGAMVMPQLEVNNTVQPANGSTDGATLAGVDSCDYSGPLLPKGYFFQFANHDKVYVTTAATGTAPIETLSFFPSLRADVPDNTAVNLGDSVTFNYFRDLDTLQGITYRDGVLVDPGTIRLLEAL